LNTEYGEMWVCMLIVHVLLSELSELVGFYRVYIIGRWGGNRIE
jgi:hypothetical protein